VNAAYDPVVAEALARIAPNLDADPELLLRRAKEARTPRRRAWLVRGGALAFAGIVVAGGVAVAATKLDLVPWLKTKSRSNIRFSIDPHRHYRGPAPVEVRCPVAGSAVFTCRAVAVRQRPRLASPHTFRLAERIQGQPRLTRKYVLEQLDAAEERGAVSPLLARRIRLDAEAVSNDFFAKLNVVVSVQSIGTSPAEVEPRPGRRAVVLVPPKDQPVIVVCSGGTSSALTCRDLAAAQGVPIGAPVYMLEPSKDWPHALRQPKLSVPAPAGLVEHVFGRPLRPTERRLLFELAGAFARGGAAHASSPAKPGR
jgi:rhodanese-related sulfurtransferase